jgi:hypothetical protein
MTPTSRMHGSLSPRAPGLHGVRICQKFETLRPRCFSKMLATPCSDGRLDHCTHDEYSGLKVKPFAHPAFFPRS